MSTTPGSNVGAAKRPRIVEGSCWPCKTWRIKCDLRKPACSRCQTSGSECNYDKLLLRWNTRRSRAASTPQATISALACPEDASLAINEKRALDYFRGRLWPLLSASGSPYPPPVSLALRSKPVLQAACIFAEAHRSLQERGQTSKTLINRRLSCLADIRGHLADVTVQKSALYPLLVAVLLLYHSDGYVDCLQQHASMESHHTGAVAIINTLGGFDSVWATAETETKMLLAEFATTDLIEASLRNRRPSFSPSIWAQIEEGPVWWDNSRTSTGSLAIVFATLAEMILMLHEDQGDSTAEKIMHFELTLQPTFSVLDDFMQPGAGTEPATEKATKAALASRSLCHAFKHAALIYLYRGVAGLPTTHQLVQQHVQSCLDCIHGIEIDSQVHGCVVYPLFIAGSHAATDIQKTFALSRMEAIYSHNKFGSVLSIRSTLESQWQNSAHLGTWENTFKGLATGILVL